MVFMTTAETTNCQKPDATSRLSDLLLRITMTQFKIRSSSVFCCPNDSIPMCLRLFSYVGNLRILLSRTKDPTTRNATPGRYNLVRTTPETVPKISCKHISASSKPSSISIFTASSASNLLLPVGRLPRHRLIITAQTHSSLVCNP